MCPRPNSSLRITGVSRRTTRGDNQLAKNRCLDCGVEIDQRSVRCMKHLAEQNSLRQLIKLEAEDKQIVQWLDEGKKARDLQRLLGVSKTMVYRKLAGAREREARREALRQSA